MQRTRIKICGIRDHKHAQVAVDAGSDYIGFVFVNESPRVINVEAAYEIAKTLPDHVVPVGLFVDVPRAPLPVLASRAGVKAVQLHGHEPVELLDVLDGYMVWKAMPFDDLLVENARLWENASSVHALLIDTPPKGALTGGSGTSFDWQALADIKADLKKPIILAGGLTPDNVGEAIRIVRPYAVDVSSGVESSRGVKDVGLIKAFCDAVREADAQRADDP